MTNTKLATMNLAAVALGLLALQAGPIPAQFVANCTVLACFLTAATWATWARFSARK